MMKINSYITPIQKLNKQFNDNKFFIKRDDLLPFSFGGNKVRKSLLFFEEIESQECDCVITYGSSSSNHCRIIANMAAVKNLKCFIISPNETIKNTYNTKMIDMFGAEVEFCPVSKVSETIENKKKELIEKGYNPYFIQGGGHGILGTKAYIDAYEEIKSYEKENNTWFDYMFLTSGTGTTQAGLVCGQIVNSDSRQVIGISNARKNPYGKQVVLESINEYLDSIGRENLSVQDINFIDDYIINGYGSYNDEILNTINEVMIKEGIPLDKIYTGKAFWGMIEYIKKHQIRAKNILFIHTGGTPLFFDDLEELVDV